jgi:two-component system, OmpR family, response regulator
MAARMQSDGTRETDVRIAVVEDDDHVRRLLRTMFETEGYAVSEARDSTELYQCLKSFDVALITLDLNLPREDGLSVARTVRKTSDVPIIMVSAKSCDVDRIVGLELGADDYIVKPFNVREVLARVRAVLRRTRPQNPAAQTDDRRIFAFGDWVLDATARELRSQDGRETSLTGAEFKMLEALVMRPFRVLSRDQLIDLVGGRDAGPLERSVDTLIGRLRKKIEIDPVRPQILKTARGAGYVFSAKVTAR